MNQNSKYLNKHRKYSTFDYGQSDNYEHFGKEKSVRKVSTDVSSSSNNYKTQVCKFWGIGQPCPFDQHCKFAHGDVEIRSKDGISEKYKTRQCKNFYQNIYCPYGQRCQFIHHKPQKSKITNRLCQVWFGIDYKDYHLTYRYMIKAFRRRQQQYDNRQKYVVGQCSSIKVRRTDQNTDNNELVLNPQPMAEDSLQFFNYVQNTQDFPKYFQKPRLYSL